MSDIYTVKRDGMRLDQVARETLGTWTDGIVETIVGLNPGLADLPAILPVGTRIVLPPRPTTAPARRTVARIWGDA